MNNCLIISFDYHRVCDSTISFAVTNLLAYIRERVEDKSVSVDSYSFNMNEIETIMGVQYSDFLSRYDLSKYQLFAISLYCWDKEYVNVLINRIKALNPKALIVLGGYEVSLTDEVNLVSQYPSVDKFIAGYGEESLLALVKDEEIQDKIIYREVDIKNVPLLYSSQLVDLIKDQKVRIESKRGCIYRCTFCSHRDNVKNNFLEKDSEHVIEELKFLNSAPIAKVNFVDPIFNVGETYIEILKAMVEMNFKHLVSFQVRFETIKGEIGKQFLDLIAQLNCVLEFGLQTTNPEETRIISRMNNLTHVAGVMEELNRRNISYIVSLIYGLPLQTFESFNESVQFLQLHRCPRIECNPLMLLTGTKLYQEREQYGLIEEKINGINYVVSSSTFTKDNYKRMQELAAMVERINKVFD